MTLIETCRNFRHGVKVGPGPQDPGPRNHLKFKSGTPGPASKFKSGTPASLLKFKSGTTLPFFNEFIFFLEYFIVFLLIYLFVFFKQNTKNINCE